MSALLENTAEELGDLIGATIEHVWVERDDDPYGMEEVVRMRVRYRKSLRVNGATHGEYELWQDCEGNGPGFLSFVQAG